MAPAPDVRFIVWRRRKRMERAVFVYTTYPSAVEAEKAGRALIERSLAACVNILPGMISLYRWEGAIERGEEAVMIIKTRASLAEEVRTAVKEMHPYTTPAILVIPLESVDSSYLTWLLAGTEAATG
jgi:periplasmic divalent cation tolerance protein